LVIARRNLVDGLAPQKPELHGAVELLKRRRDQLSGKGAKFSG